MTTPLSNLQPTTKLEDYILDDSLEDPNNEDGNEDEDEDEDEDEGTSQSEQDSDLEDISISESETSAYDKQDSAISSSYSRSNSNPIDYRPKRKKTFKKHGRSKNKRKALAKLRAELEVALEGNFLKKDKEQSFKDIVLWGVPLLPSKRHQGTDTVLLKFLKAQRYDVENTLENIRETLIWREENSIDDRILHENVEDDWNDDLNKVVFVDSVDKNGHPLCFNLYGAFKDKALYNKTFGTEQNKKDFLRWRVRFLERSIQKLDFKDGGVDSFVLISDMKNIPGPGKQVKEVGPISKDAVTIFQRYYPELIRKHIIINTPFWYYLYHVVVSQYCTNGTKKKFVFARPNKVTETLLKYIPPQNLPIQYGGLRRENDDEFTSEDKVVEYSLRGGALSTFHIPIPQGQVTMVWETMVVGWDVTYKDEFIPDDEGSYKISLQNEKKIVESIRNSFYVHEPGKILISIKNTTYVKKRAFIRHKTKITLPVYLSSSTDQL